jgi:hypothetical protein
MVAIERRCIARKNFGSLRKLVSLKWSSSYPKVIRSLSVVRSPLSKAELLFLSFTAEDGIECLCPKGKQVCMGMEL